MVKQTQTICRQFDAKWSNLLAKWANYITSCVPGSKHGQLRFQDFGHRHWREMRKNQYYYYDTFLTIDIDLCVKYKRDIRFHYEI